MMCAKRTGLSLLTILSVLLGFALAHTARISAAAAPAALAPAGSETLNASLASAQAYIDALTINSTVNVPQTVVPNTSLFFSWDNERRAPPAKPYLYEWSYYNGVVFEGSRYVYDATGVATYSNYADAYLDAMVTNGALNSYAGYVSYHGLDCYKTASLLRDFDNSEYNQVAATLYNDLTVVNASYSEAALGYNYWHTWISGAAPTYKVWLDGLYMGQPFLAEYAYHVGDTAQLDKVATRLDWVHDNLRNAGTGLFYHAGNSSTSYVNYHWLRAIGWYAMAQVDVMPYMSGANLDLLKANFKVFVDGMLPYQDATTGMWRNLVNVAQSSTNRLETSGTAMMSYAILKAVRNGWLADPAGTYVDAAIEAFEGIVNNKLINGNLTDIYLKASATGSNDYEDASRYYSNEGKGVGPFIMAYAEALRVAAATPISAMYLGSSASGAIGGVSFADEDIFRRESSAGAWSLFVDGSDIGLAGTDIDAFELMADGSMLMSFDIDFTLAGFGPVDDSDILRFTPSSTGDATAGAWEWYFDGSDVGLTKNDEDIDALALLPDGRLLISVFGNVTVPDVSGKDEDLLVFTPSQLGADTSGTWAMYFDGSDVGLADVTTEDIKGVWVNGSGSLYLTTLGSFSVTAISGDGTDIFKCTPGSTGDTTTCTFSMVWDGSENGFAAGWVDSLGIIE